MIRTPSPSSAPSRWPARTVCWVDWPLTNSDWAMASTKLPLCSVVIDDAPDRRSIPAEVSDATCDIGLHHFLWIDDAIEFGFSHKSQLQRGDLESQVVVHGVVRDLRRLVVPDDR